MLRTLVVLSLAWCLTLCPLLATAGDYERGWCDGFRLATEASMRNRDHWRALVGLPVRSHADVIADAHTTWPPSQCQDLGTVVEQVMCLEGVSIDLYVVLPAWREEKQTFVSEEGRAITCPVPPEE